MGFNENAVFVFILQNLDEYIVELKLKAGSQSSINQLNAAKIANLKSELLKKAKSEKALRSRNAELIRSKAIIESKSQDLSRKLDAANKSVADYELEIAKLTARNTKLRSEMDELRSANEKCRTKPHVETSKMPQKLSDLKLLSESLDSSLGELTMTKIEHYESDVLKQEKSLSKEREELQNEKTKLKAGIVGLTSKFEKYQKNQDNYMRKLEKERSTQIASILDEKRNLEVKFSTMAKEMRFINDVLKCNKIDKAMYVQESREVKMCDGRHTRSSSVNLKAIAARYRTTQDKN